MKFSQSCPTLQPHGLYSPWDSPGQNTGVGSLLLLQGKIPTQGLNPGLLHCRQIVCQLSHKGSPILEYKVKWALGSITSNKASGGDGIPVGLFQILRWCCESVALNMPANLGNSAVATRLEKVSFHSNPKEGQCQRIHKLPRNCTHLTC